MALGMMTAKQLITDAKTRAFPFIREDQFNPGQMLSQLTALDQEVLHWYATMAPERVDTQAPAVTVVASSTVVPLSIIPNNINGYPLQPAYAYSQFRYTDSSGFVWTVNLVPQGHVDHPMLHPAGIIRGGPAGIFFPVDPQEVRWNPLFGSQTRQFWIGNGDTFSYSYVPYGVQVTALSQSLLSPDEASDYMIAALTLHILLNSADIVPPPRLQVAQLQWQQKKQDLQINIMKRSEARFRAGEQA